MYKFFVACCFSFSLFGYNFHDFDQYQEVYTREEIQNKIEKFLAKDSLEGVRIENNALIIGDLTNHSINYSLRFAKTSSPKKVEPRKSLSQAKIAIDPGHFGGKYAKLEERFVKISKDLVGSEEDVEFNEGTLTFLTALELKRLLENEGATVFLTKNAIGEGAIAADFFQWLSEKPELWKTKESLTSLFKIYNRVDLYERAKKINEFGPDITIVIHYNAEDKITYNNYNLVFIPGAFKKGELQQEQDRYKFLRLLLTDHVEESLCLSQSITNAFAKQLQVPLISEESPGYIKAACLKVAPGLFARNLTLTRLVESPLCYGETLIQNNEQEAATLNEKDCEIAGIPCSSRIKSVAEAYFLGIKQYYGG